MPDGSAKARKEESEETGGTWMEETGHSRGGATQRTFDEVLHGVLRSYRWGLRVVIIGRLIQSA